MSNKDLTKEQLEHDPMVDSYAKVVAFFSTHRNLLVGILAGAVVLIGGAIGLDFYRKSTEEKASRLMSFAEMSFNKGDYEKALKGDEENFTLGFEAIASKYGSTNAGNLALYYAAICEYNLGNAETALSFMKSFDIPDGIMGLAALGFYGNLLLDTGSFEDAAKTFEKAASWVKSETTTPYYLAKSAQAWLDAGKTDKAKAIANKIIDNYPSASEVGVAQRIAGAL
jgi:TolA-binding protein